MFAILPWNFELVNATTDVFRVLLLQDSYSPVLNLVNQSHIAMVPCTKEHFRFTTETENIYNLYNMSTALCPPLNYEFNIQGKLTSNVYNEISINIARCDPAFDPQCMTDADFTTLEQNTNEFLFTVIMVNTYVNPND